jgi:hypothetical protein
MYFLALLTIARNLLLDVFDLTLIFFSLNTPVGVEFWMDEGINIFK